MKEAIIGAIAIIFALTYNIVLFVLNLECANDKFVKPAILLMSANTLKDATILGAILVNTFLR